MRITSTTATLVVLYLTGVDAFWRLPCAAPLVVERADPVVSPGQVSGHVHTIMGGNGFGFTMDYADTQESTCSSCRVTKDMSNYWVPSLYHKNDDGTFTDVDQVGGSLIYYLQRSDPADPEYAKGLLAFPKDFRMLAGNPMLRSFNNTLEQRAISFACLGVSGPETNYLPLQNCPSGVRAQVFFPSCWDGVNLDSADHKSHMAYPSNVDSGKCPTSHPKRFISLFYEVVWDTAKFNPTFDVAAKKQPFVFANGDETGYGYHGDFVNGWDVPTLQRAVTECTNLSGNVEDCPVFTLFSNDFSNSCKIPTSVDEKVSGTLAALPGCNPATGEGANAVKVTGCGAPTTISPPQNPFVDLTVSKKFEYIGCGTDNIGGRTLTGASFDQKDMTNEKCVDLCISKGFSIAGTEYSTQCYCGNSLPAARAPIDGLMGDCFMPCSGDATENCGGAGTISLYQKCGATCSNIVYGVNNDTTPAAASSTVAVVPGTVATSAAVVKVSTVAAVQDAVSDSSPKDTSSIVSVSASSAISTAKPATASKTTTTSKITTTSKTSTTSKTTTTSSKASTTSKAKVGVVHHTTSATTGANTKVAAKCAGEVTVTVAATTITVTERSVPSSTPETGVKVPAKQNAVVDDAASTAPAAGEDDEDTSAVESSIPTSTANIDPIYPTIAPTDGQFNNGTAVYGTTGNGGASGRAKGHGRFHHRPSGGYAAPTAGKKN